MARDPTEHFPCQQGICLVCVTCVDTLTSPHLTYKLRARALDEIIKVQKYEAISWSDVFLPADFGSPSQKTCQRSFCASQRDYWRSQGWQFPSCPKGLIWQLRRRRTASLLGTPGDGDALDDVFYYVGTYNILY